VIVVRDRAKRIALRQLAQLGFADYAAHEKAGIRAFAPGLDGIWHGPAIDLDEARRTPGVWPFVDHLEDVPELLLVTVDLTMLAIMDNPLDRQSIVGGASTYPFVAHLLLAARGEGLAGVMTTFVIREEPEARKILGFPDHVALAAMVALGYPEHQNSKLTRKPVEEFARIDSWDGPPLTA
jgi:nitroreductase